MKVNEENFIKLLRKKNDKSLEYAIDIYTPIVSSVVNKVLYNFGKEAVEECVSDVFISIWYNIERFKGENKDFKNWICTIARFKAIDYYRKLAKEKEDNNLDGFISKDVLDEIIINEDKKEIVNMLSYLNLEDRKIFSMRFLLGFGVKDISKTLKLSESVISNRIYKGKKKLKNLFLKNNTREGDFYEKI